RLSAAEKQRMETTDPENCRNQQRTGRTTKQGKMGTEEKLIRWKVVFLQARLLFIPILKEMFNFIDVKRSVGITHFKRFMDLNYTSIHFDDDYFSVTCKSN